MAARFDSTEFGSVTINGKRFFDVLVVGEKITERNIPLLKKLFGTSHRISEEEARLLVSNAPEIVIVGSGQDGVLKVDDGIKKMIEEKARLVVLKTPEAIKEYNELAGKRKVNALIHTTC